MTRRRRKKKKRKRRKEADQVGDQKKTKVLDLKSQRREYNLLLHVLVNFLLEIHFMKSIIFLFKLFINTIYVYLAEHFNEPKASPSSRSAIILKSSQKLSEKDVRGISER